MARAPDPAFLLDFPGEQDLPPEVRDDRIVLDATAWLERVTASPGPEESRTGQPLSGRELPEAGAVRVDRAHTVANVNVVFVSHCNFTGNSALHVYSIASELHRRGLSPAIAVPENAGSVEDIGRPPFAVLTYDDLREGRLRFPDGRGPDLVHAFTPREHVRKTTEELVRRHGCRYVVHLEDNEEAIVSAELGGATFAELRRLPPPMLDSIIGPGQSHPRRAPRFIEGAAAITAVVEPLLELKPSGLPGAVVRPGFDEIMLLPTRPRDEVRAELRLGPHEIAIVYPGSVNRTNLDEMRTLYLAIAELRRDGHPVTLVKTGLNWEDMSQLPDLGDGIRDLGWVPRLRVPELLAAADILVQPGRPGPYSDYRYPSKLPEFLASGHPVVLPRANLGLQLRDGDEALLLECGDTAEIYEKVALLAADASLRASIGGQGRAFALRELRWPASVDKVEGLYRRILSAPAPLVAPVREDRESLVTVIAFAQRSLSADEARRARAHGVEGFCFTLEPELDPASIGPRLDSPFCLRCTGARPADAVLPALLDPRYIRVGGAPLLLADSLDATAGLRELARRELNLSLQLALVERSDSAPPREDGFDSLVEQPTRVGSNQELDHLMRERLRIPLRDRTWARTMPSPDTGSAPPGYAIWLRKLVLQTLLCSSGQRPLLFVDASNGPIERVLSAVRVGLRDGIRQFYASQQLDVSDRQADEILGIAGR